MLELLILGALFVLVSGILAMIDAAVLNVSPAEVEVLIAKKKWGAKELKKLLFHTTRAIIVIVIFTNVTNILGPILVGRRAETLFGSEAIGIVTAILTFATIIFSEIIPKSIGAHNAPRISRRVAPLLLVLITLLYPIVLVLERMVRLFKNSGKRHVGTEEQIRALANIGGGAGHIDADERELIHRAFVLNDRRVRDIMVPAPQIIFVRKGTSIAHAAETVFKHSFSRYPVVGSSMDDIQGFVLSLDILRELAEGGGSGSVGGLLRKGVMVDADMRCDELLNVLKKSPPQFAIVREQGKTVGLVTLEDVLGQLVGKIADSGTQ